MTDLYLEKALFERDRAIRALDQSIFEKRFLTLICFASIVISCLSWFECNKLINNKLEEQRQWLEQQIVHVETDYKKEVRGTIVPNLSSEKKHKNFNTSFRKSPYSKTSLTALMKYGSTILSYEVPNANISDREFVACVLLNNLEAYHRMRPSLDSDTLMAYLGKKWNPNKHKNFSEISLEVKKNRKSPSNYGQSSLNNIANGEMATIAGNFACANRITEFAHLQSYPGYYINGQYFRGNINTNLVLKYPLVFARATWKEKYLA